MALLVLLSTLFITIEKHYCADRLVDVAVFSKAKSCCSASESSKSESKKDGCCKNETDLLVGQDELSLTKTQTLTSVPKAFVLSLAYVYGGFIEEEKEPNVVFDHYSPPKLFEDIYRLNEVYLI